MSELLIRLILKIDFKLFLGETLARIENLPNLFMIYGESSQKETKFNDVQILFIFIVKIKI